MKNKFNQTKRKWTKRIGLALATAYIGNALYWSGIQGIDIYNEKKHNQAVVSVISAMEEMKHSCKELSDIQNQLEEVDYHYRGYDHTILFETDQEREKFASGINGLGKRLDKSLDEISDKEKEIQILMKSPEYREFEKKQFEYKIKAFNPFYRSRGEIK